VIRSFRCPDTERLFKGFRVIRFRAIEKTALRKLIYLDQATSLIDLARVPGHRLEPLKGDRQGQHSIRINDQYRICCVWVAETREQNAYDVEIVDYH
jgi:proteic killer suppression protein